MRPHLWLYHHEPIKEYAVKVQHLSFLLPLLLPIVGVAEDNVVKHWEVGFNSSKVGELGKSNGAELGYRFSPQLRARVTQTKLNYQTNTHFADVDFTEKLDQKDTSLMLDWFPSKTVQGAYTSLGLVKLADPATLRTVPNPTKVFTFNGTNYTALSPINGVVKTNTQVPVIGLGYQYAPKSSGFFMQASVNHVFDLNPKIIITPEVNIAGTLQGDLQAEANKKNGELKNDYTLYGVSIGYRF